MRPVVAAPGRLKTMTSEAPWPSLPEKPATLLSEYEPFPPARSDESGITARYVRSGQHELRDAPISEPVRATPWNTTVLSGPPSVVQYRYAVWSVAPRGTPLMTMFPEEGPPARVARPTPFEARSPPVSVNTFDQ